MEVRRLRPNEGAAKAIVDVVSRVKHLETRPSGTIYIDDRIVGTDPNTGNEIIIGEQPDGSWGIDPNVNDITPPGQPTTPTVTGSMGGLEVWWDGLEVGGTPQPKDYTHTDLEYTLASAENWQLGGTFLTANGMVIGNLEVGTKYRVRLISYDANKNASDPSTSVEGTPVSFVDNPDVDNALQELRDADRENASNSAKAQQSASAADAAATKAAADALKAMGIADGKGRVIYAPTAPTAVEDRSVNNLWIDTSGDIPKNTPHRWDVKTNTWIVVTDKVAVDAGIKAGQAEQIANAASAIAAAAAAAAGDAQTAANGKNRVWYLPTRPAGNDHTVNDIWYDESNGNMIHRWNGTQWVGAQDAAIAKADKKAVDAAAAASAAGSTATDAATAADNAAKAAGAKGKVIIQNAAPDAADRLAQNLWIDTTGGANTPKRWNGTAWVAVTDKAALDAASVAATAKSRADEAYNKSVSAAEAAGLAQESANGKNRSWYSATKPTGTSHQIGDTWFDEANGNRPMFWNGTDWVSVQDKIWENIDQKVDKVTVAANGKNSVYFTGTAPVSTTAKPLVVGDTWFNTSDGNKVKVWSAGKWNDAADADIAAATTAAEGALRSANGKNSITYNTAAPTLAQGAGRVIGDTWFRIDASGVAFGQWTWTGTEWRVTQLRHEIFASIDAAKISVGVIDANRISSKSIATDKLLISSTDNIVQDADFTDPTGVSWGGYAAPFSRNATAGRDGGPAMVIALASNQQGRYNPEVPAAGPSAYRLGAWVKSSVAAPLNSISVYLRQRHAGVTSLLSVKNSEVIPANTWYYLSGIVNTRTDITSVQTGIFAETALGSGTMWTDFVSATRATDATLVVDGSITSKSVTTDGLNAGVITFGEMDGLRIKAGTIDTSRLLVGAIDNLAGNPQLVDNGRGWDNGLQAGTGSGYTTTVVFPGMAASVLMTQKAAGAATPALYTNSAARVPVSPGEAFHVSSAVYTTAASAFSSISQRVYFFNAEGAMLTGSPGNMEAGTSITSIANRTWVEVGGQVIVPTGAVAMTMRLTVYYPVGYTPNSAIFYVGNPKIYRMSGTTLIEKGSIVTEHMTSGTIDGKVITGGTIKGAQIEAKTISTDNLLITSTDNLIQEADFGAKGIGWKLLGTTVVDATNGRNGGPALKITAAAGLQQIYNKYTAAVEPGNVYRLTTWVKSTVALPVRTFCFMATPIVASGTRSGIRIYNNTAGTDKVIAANTWTKVTGLVTIPDSTATVEFALEVPASVTSGTIYVDFASVARAMDGELVVDGSITSTSIVTAGLDAAVIKVGTLDAARIGAQTITAEKLVIGQGSNLMSDPNFLNAESNTIRGGRSTGTWTFPVDSGTGLSSARTTTTVVDTRFNFGHYVRSAANAAKMIPAIPEEKYLVEASVYTNAATGLRWYFDVVYGDGTNALITPMSYESKTGRRNLTHEFIVPAKVVAFQPVLQANTSGVTLIIDGGVTVAKKVEGNLIVDGALTGKTITGALIQSVVEANRGIKLNASEFVAYNNSGVETLRLSGNTATITGATIRTAATGVRVVMDSTGLQAFPATGSEPYLSATAKGLNLTGTLESTLGGIEGISGTVISRLGPTLTGGGIRSFMTVPGLSWIIPSMAATTDSPPSLVTRDGLSLIMSGRQDTFETPPGVVIAHDHQMVTVEGDLEVYNGRVRQLHPMGRHLEWTRAQSAAARQETFLPTAVIDLAKSPGISLTSDGREGTDYLFAKWINTSSLAFLSHGVYQVSVKATTSAPMSGTAYIVIYEDDWPAQISYFEVGGNLATLSSNFYMPMNSALKIAFYHSNTGNITATCRVKATMIV